MGNKNELARLNKIEQSFLIEETARKSYYYEIRSGKVYLAVYDKAGNNLSLVHHPELNINGIKRILEWYNKLD